MNPIQIYGDKANPFPAPQGRWLAAAYLVENRKRVVGRWNDPWVHEAVPFLRALRRNGNQAAQKWPHLHEAHALYSAPPGLRRWELEARLLTTQPLDQVAAKCSISPEALEAYHGIFFNVRDRLSARAYILDEVIGPKIHFGLRESDVDVILKWLAYLKGELFLDRLLDYYRHPPVIPERPELLDPAGFQELRDKFMTRAMIVRATLPVDAAFRKNAAILNRAVRYFEHRVGPDLLSAPMQNLFAFQVAQASDTSAAAPKVKPPAAAEEVAATAA